jgi:hypothetical protein
MFEHVTLLLQGAILAPGKRIISSILRIMGKRNDQHFQTEHRY